MGNNISWQCVHSSIYLLLNCLVSVTPNCLWLAQVFSPLLWEAGFFCLSKMWVYHTLTLLFYHNSTQKFLSNFHLLLSPLPWSAKIEVAFSPVKTQLSFATFRTPAGSLLFMNSNTLRWIKEEFEGSKSYLNF